MEKKVPEWWRNEAEIQLHNKSQEEHIERKEGSLRFQGDNAMQGGQRS